MWCTECMAKDELIEKKELEIKHLRKKLLAAQKKNWHLETVKRKLDESLLDLKNRSVVDEQLSGILEVYTIFINMATASVEPVEAAT